MASRKCTGKKADGVTPCSAWAIKGGLVCVAHGGKAPQVIAKAKIRLEVEGWGLGDTTVDPGETLLRLLTQAAHRAERYAAEVGRMVEQHGLHDALVGQQYVLNPNNGRLQQVGEYVRGLAVLEAQERDRAAKFATQAIAAGLAERQVRLAEKQGALIEQVLSTVFTELGLTDEQRQLAPEIIRRALSAVA